MILKLTLSFHLRHEEERKRREKKEKQVHLRHEEERKRREKKEKQEDRKREAALAQEQHEKTQGNSKKPNQPHPRQQRTDTNKKEEEEDDDDDDDGDLADLLLVSPRSVLQRMSEEKERLAAVKARAEQGARGTDYLSLERTSAAPKVQVTSKKAIEEVTTEASGWMPTKKRIEESYRLKIESLTPSNSKERSQPFVSDVMTPRGIVGGKAVVALAQGPGSSFDQSGSKDSADRTRADREWELSRLYKHLHQVTGSSASGVEASEFGILGSNQCGTYLTLTQNPNPRY